MNTLKKMTALLLASAMLLPAFACSGDSSNESNAEGNENVTTTTDPYVVTDEGGGQNHVLMFEQYGQDEDGNPVINSTAPSNGGGSTTTTVTGEGPNAIVTTFKKGGQVYSPVTDINGATVTDAKGETKTEVYTGTTLATQYKDESYEPDYKSYLAFWLDISERKDFVFEGDLVEFEFKIADDCPDGVYPIQIFMTDFSSYDGVTYDNIKTNVGYVCVNADKPNNIDTTLGSGMTLTAETISAKPGETARLNIQIGNNAGIAGFRFAMRYDGKAMDIVDAGAGKDLASLATLTAHEINSKD